MKKLVFGNTLKLFVGIGNVLRSDDGVGVYIAQRIKERDGIKILVVEVSIENYIGPVNAIHPDELILIDAVNFDKDPGYFALHTPDKLLDYTTNTHNISLKKLMGFFDSNVWILGIQPENVDFGENISPLVRHAADEIIELINSGPFYNR
ncbi:MAG: hydrogenase maturation protease [Bacteroidales bacterium]|nr:hydrogenase maturation protease [Bacteroidales bacterium]